MSAHSNLDREAFQTLLASAFSVQQSGINKQSLAALVELQKSITKHESFDEILALIADRARIVANATGIAIGILTQDRLVYRAGSGSAARCIGQHLTAVLSLSEHRSRREILRVENAEADPRIEAAICREHEARALLMVPICGQRNLAGVLEILFSDPHVFGDSEIRTYRLMAGLVEEAMLGDSQRGEKNALATQPPAPAVPHSMETPPPMKVFYRGDNPDVQPSMAQASGRSPRIRRTPSTLCPPAKDEKTIRWPARLSLFHDRRWTVDAALIVIILGLAAWISNHQHASPGIEGSARVEGSSPLPKPSAATFPERSSSSQKASGRTGPASRTKSPFRRVRVGPNEVDYVAEDVIIRHFTAKAAVPHATVANKQFAIGDDVTVRIFTDADTVTPKTSAVSRR